MQEETPGWGFCNSLCRDISEVLLCSITRFTQTRVLLQTSWHLERLAEGFVEGQWKIIERQSEENLVIFKHNVWAAAGFVAHQAVRLPAASDHRKAWQLHASYSRRCGAGETATELLEESGNEDTGKRTDWNPLLFRTGAGLEGQVKHSNHSQQTILDSCFFFCFFFETWIPNLLFAPFLW